MVKKIVFIIPVLLFSSEVVCRFEEQKIICTYFIDRSDNVNGLKVRFFWRSPNGRDNRIKKFKVPPYHGSVYDYRFLPGRVQGRWKVVVTELESNKSASAYFDINESEDFFEE